MIRRTLIAVTRVTRKFNALLSSLWDACVVGIDRCVKFRGYTYSTADGANGKEVHITCEKTGSFLGCIREGVLYQCA